MSVEVTFLHAMKEDAAADKVAKAIRDFGYENDVVTVMPRAGAQIKTAIPFASYVTTG